MVDNEISGKDNYFGGFVLDLSILNHFIYDLRKMASFMQKN